MDLGPRLPERSGVTELHLCPLPRRLRVRRARRPVSGLSGPGNNLRQLARPAIPAGHRNVRARLWFRGADAGGAAVHLDRADLLQVLAAVEGEGEDLLLDHALDEDLLAVLRPGGALAPMADRGFRDLRQVVAGEAEDLHQAEIVEERRFLRLVRAVHHRDGDVLAVRRHLQPLGRLPDRDRVDDPRRLHLEIDDADRVGVAAAEPDIGDDRDVAVAGGVDLVGAQPGVDVALPYSTLSPATVSTEILWSLSRVTSAIAPSRVKTGWLGPEFASPSLIFSFSSTLPPEIVSTETVPSLRFATSARVPALLIDTPAAPFPTVTVCVTLGGEDLRSMTERLSSGTCFVGSAGSTFMAAVTRAKLSSAATATLPGGPATLAGAWISARSFGGFAERSMIATVSGGAFGTVLATPLSR